MLHVKKKVKAKRKKKRPIEYKMKNENKPKSTHFAPCKSRNKPSIPSTDL